MARPGRRPLTQAQKVFNAVKKGAQSPKEIAAKTGVPVRNVGTLLYNLRKSGNIRGLAGKMKAAKYPASTTGGRRKTTKKARRARRGR